MVWGSTLIPSVALAAEKTAGVNTQTGYGQKGGLSRLFCVYSVLKIVYNRKEIDIDFHFLSCYGIGV